MSPDTPLDDWGSQIPRGLRERHAAFASRRRTATTFEGQGAGVVASGAIEGPGRRETGPRREILLGHAAGAGTPHPRDHFRVARVPQSAGDPDHAKRWHEDEVKPRAKQTATGEAAEHRS